MDTFNTRRARRRGLASSHERGGGTDSCLSQGPGPPRQSTMRALVVHSLYFWALAVCLQEWAEGCAGRLKEGPGHRRGGPASVPTCLTSAQIPLPKGSAAGPRPSSRVSDCKYTKQGWVLWRWVSERGGPPAVA